VKGSTTLRDRLPIPIRLGNWIFIKKFSPASGGKRRASGSRKMRGKRWPNNFRAKLSGIPFRYYGNIRNFSVVRYPTNAVERREKNEKRYVHCVIQTKRAHLYILLLCNSKNSLLSEIFVDEILCLKKICTLDLFSRT